MRKLSATQAQLARIRGMLRTRTLRVSYLLPQDEKRTWGPGPWVAEPDMVRWIDKRSGLPCMVARHSEYGNFCGYVGVPADHLMYGVKYSSGVIPSVISILSGEQPSYELTPHEGVNWSDYCPFNPEDKEHWYFGYDCGHAHDYKPGVEALLRHLRFKRSKLAYIYEAAEDSAETALLDQLLRPVYRPVSYCIAECTRLASQLICSV